MTVFLGTTYFTDGNEKTFEGRTEFRYAYFEPTENVVFNVEDLSKVSFMNTDITRVRFSDKARWGERDKFKIIEEEMLEQFIKYSFDWENITTTNSYTERLKDLLSQMGVNWKGDLQFTAC
jgi:hypothetical protein